MEETLLNHSTIKKCNLIVAMFQSVAFVPPDEHALVLWLSW